MDGGLGVLQSMGLQRVGHDSKTELNWTDDASCRFVIHDLYYVELWAMAPHSSTLSLGKSHGQRSLVGCGQLGREESDTAERLHFSLSCMGEENATHSSVLAWRIPGTGESGGLPSMGSHRVGHDWNDLPVAVLNFPTVNVDFLIFHLLCYFFATCPLKFCF